MRGFCCKWLLTAVLAAALLTGCAEKPVEPTTPQPDMNAGALYAAARKTAEAADDLVLEYTLEETRTVGENTFTKRVTGKSSYQSYAQSGMTALVEETLDFGYYRCSYKETYCEEKAYALINDCLFWSNQSPEAFAARQLPPVLLTPALYNTVTYGETPETVQFSQPRGLEAWVGEGQLLDASGTAILDSEGKLLQTTYQVRYQKGAAEYTLSATVRVTVPERLDMSAAHGIHGQTSTWLSSLDAPRYLVQVVADVYAAQYVKCEMTESIVSEAIPLSYDRSSRVLLKGRENALQAEILNTSKLSNNRGVVTESSQSEYFQKGVYTLSVDGSDPVRNGSVTAVDMRQYGEDTVLSGLLAVKYLRGVTVHSDGALLRLELDGNESFRKAMTQQLMAVLQVDLDARAESARTYRSDGYLTVNTQTGLPVGMGMYLEKSHTIDGVAYRLDYRLEENLTFTEE